MSALNKPLDMFSDWVELPAKHDGGSSLVRKNDIQHFRCQPEYSDPGRSWAIYLRMRYTNECIERKDVPAETAKLIARRIVGHA